jgi:hypothetical protein
MRRAVLVMVCGLAFAGCVRAKNDAPSATREASLGKRATVTPASPTSASSTTTSSVGIGSAGSSTTTGSGSGPSRSSSGGSAVAATDDAAGDQGADGPAYSDLRGVVVESAGGSARVTVTVGANLPGRLGSGEVMGIGVDLYRTGQAESDYQLFADGESDGWTGYLQTPGGFVAYPGTLTVTGSALVFVVPWTSLGDPHQGEIAAFADWSKKTLLKTIASSDKAPDTGRATLRR